MNKLFNGAKVQYGNLRGKLVKVGYQFYVVGMYAHKVKVIAGLGFKNGASSIGADSLVIVK